MKFLVCKELWRKLFIFAQNLLEIKQKGGEEIMAKPIKETPILYGEDARRFEARMKEKRTESPEAKKRRLMIYEMLRATANF